MSKEQPWMPGDVYFGGPEVPLPDWRAEASPSDEDDDAPPSEEERQALIKMLGFDPSGLFLDGPVQEHPTIPPSPFLKSLFDYKIKGIEEGKPCTQGHTQERDRCIPENPEVGPSPLISSDGGDIKKGDSVIWNGTAGWKVKEVYGPERSNQIKIIKGNKSSTEKIVEPQNVTKVEKGKVSRTSPKPDATKIPETSPKQTKPVAEEEKSELQRSTIQREEVLARIIRASKYGKDAMKVIEGVLDEFAAPAAMISIHGMALKENLRSIAVGGTRIYFSDYLAGRRNAANTIHMLTVEIDKNQYIPIALLDATEEIVFSKQQNKDESYWKGVYHNFTASEASGGDSKICVYKGRGISLGTLMHEFGHNLARSIWNNITPDANSAYGRAHAATNGRPVTEYGGNSLAEDFAEACQLYTDVEGHEFLKNNFPRKFDAIDDIMKGKS